MKLVGIKTLVGLLGIVLLTFIVPPTTSADTGLSSKLESKLESKFKGGLEEQLFKVPNSNKNTAKSIALKKYNKAMNLIENFYKKEKGIQVSNDLNDKVYQYRVMKLGTLPKDAFKKSDLKKVIEFVKFMDLYENYDKNEKIKTLFKKYKSQSLKSEQASELFTLLPIKKNEVKTSNTSTTKKTATTEDETTINVASSNGYNPTAARDYAYEWASNSETLRNNQDFGYYAAYNDCYSCWEDCTNFVSQALAAGSMRQLDGYDWYYSDAGPADAWGGADPFYHLWKERAGVASNVSDLGVGDVVNADFNGDGDIQHTAIITSSTSSSSSDKWVTQHSWDHQEQRNLADWYDEGYTIYGYEMDKAYNGSY